MAWRLRWATLAAVLAAACSQPAQGPRTVEAPPEPPRPGDEAPPFSLSAASGDDLTLAKFEGTSSVLLYFSMGPG